ncbi:zinc finger protein 384-like isoform X3 [Limulus polyphemus]|uniref:Zinc finger protein 384-like isoform X3 n=1 Tax=Limulus polyphemus TaxID=6850 RepID=A0ABM1SDL0_LIMPO|nr:zinc finger protein 384-like isoform X3 [Limulus polyphemus]
MDIRQRPPGLACATPVISLFKLRSLLLQPRYRPHSAHGPGNAMDEARSPTMESPHQLQNMYGSHGHRNNSSSNSGSPPISTHTPSNSMLVVPQPINAVGKSPPGLNTANAASNGTGRKYQCKMCPQIFLHKSAMQHHAREIHRGEIKPHQCQQCLKSFSSNHQLTQHIRVHTGEKPYKCSYCDRRFKQLSHVQQHTRLHTGERPYRCHLTDCGRAFIQLSNLQQHLRNHDSQMERAKNRPFQCNICGKGFASENSLRTHRAKQHAALIGGANSQSCPVCHRICLNGEALMEHMRITHKDPNASGTPNKRRTTNHPCPICGKTYVNEGSLRKHITSHPETSSVSSPLRMWPCSVCQSVFTQEAGLLLHMENMRMDPKHQFAAQYVLSRAAAERRETHSSTMASLQTANLSMSGGRSGSDQIKETLTHPNHGNNQNGSVRVVYSVMCCML